MKKHLNTHLLGKHGVGTPKERLEQREVRAARLRPAPVEARSIGSRSFRGSFFSVSHCGAYSSFMQAPQSAVLFR
nr:zinc finger protein 407 [Molossus molossus]